MKKVQMNFVKNMQRKLTLTERKTVGAGALRDYDFRCLPDEILKSLDGYPSFKRYCYTNGMLYAQIKIDDSFFTIRQFVMKTDGLLK